MADRRSGPWELAYVGEVLFGRPLSGDSFYGRLLALVPSADADSRHRLRLGFPELIGAWEAWMASEAGVGWEQPWEGIMAHL